MKLFWLVWDVFAMSSAMASALVVLYLMVSTVAGRLLVDFDAMGELGLELTLAAITIPMLAVTFWRHVIRGVTNA